MNSRKKLADKASKLDFSRLPALEPQLGSTGATASGAAGNDAYRPKTAPGAMMAFATDARSELVRENERLKAAASDVDLLRSQISELSGELAQWDGAKATRLVDPRRICRSRWANRHEHSYGDPEFLALKDEILNAGGNIQPIKVRLIGSGDSECPYEIVFGHRRHQACLDLGLPVLATIENVSDQGLFVEMDRENRSRKNLSPWEQGKMYLRALEEGLFPSQRKLAEAVGVDLSALGKALNLARLPSEVVKAFSSPLDIQYRWAKPLTDALATDGNGVLGRAAALATVTDKPTSKRIFEHLVKGSPLGGGTVLPPPITTVLRSTDSQVGVFNVHSDGAVNLQLRAGALPPDRIKALMELVGQFLQAI